MHLPAELSFVILAIAALGSGYILFKAYRKRFTGKKLALASLGSIAVAYSGCYVSMLVMTTALSGN